MEQPERNESFVCVCCRQFQSLQLRDLLNHYYVVHSTDLNFSVTCNVEGCPKKFSIYNSFYKHVLRKHEQVYRNFNPCNNIEQNNELSDASDDDNNSLVEDHDPNHEEDINNNNNISGDEEEDETSEDEESLIEEQELLEDNEEFENNMLEVCRFWQGSCHKYVVLASFLLLF